MLDASGQPLEAEETGFRAGFVSFVGRPNVGKSTLTNAIVGNKVAITSSKPQTTRRAIRGIANRESGQLIIVDTPGIHRPRKLLGQRLNDLVNAVLGDVDVIAMCVSAIDPIGPGDRFIHSQVAKFRNAKKVAVVTKTDVATQSQVIERLTEVDSLGGWEAVVPLSAVSGDYIDEITELLIGLMPVSPPLYGPEQVTDAPEDEFIAELIREAALEGAREELPHSLAVTVDDRERDDSGVLTVYASIYVERDSQKGIVIGKGGAKLARVRAVSQKQIAGLLGEKIKLSLRVKVLKEWQGDPKALQRLGF